MCVFLVVCVYDKKNYYEYFVYVVVILFVLVGGSLSSWVALTCVLKLRLAVRCNKDFVVVFITLKLGMCLDTFNN